VRRKQRALLSAENLNKLANILLQMVKVRVRGGYGSKDGKKIRLMPLASATIKQRKYLQRKGKLSSKTSPHTSNLTSSGNMIDDMNTQCTPTSIIFSIDAPYSKYTQKNRPIFPLVKEEIDRALEFFKKQKFSQK